MIQLDPEAKLGVTHAVAQEVTRGAQQVTLQPEVTAEARARVEVTQNQTATVAVTPDTAIAEAIADTATIVATPDTATVRATLRAVARPGAIAALAPIQAIAP